MAEIARAEGLRRPTMTWALITPHPRANRAIADFLGMSLHDLWPDWFDRNGKLISTRRTPPPNRITRGAHPATATARRRAA